MLEEWQVRFGGRVGETDRRSAGTGAPARPGDSRRTKEDGKAVCRAKGHRRPDIQRPGGMRNAERRNGVGCPP